MDERVCYSDFNMGERVCYSDFSIGMETECPLEKTALDVGLQN